MKLSRLQKVLVGTGIVGGIAAVVAIGMKVTAVPQKPCPKPGDLVRDPNECRRCGLIALPYGPEPGMYMCERAR